MRGEPGTLCAIGPYRIAASEDPQPDEGAFLITPAGSTYLIVSVRELPRRRAERRYRFACLRQRLADVPDDAATFSLVWDRRRRV